MKRSCAGLLVRRECWALSRKAKLLLLGLALLGGFGLVRCAYPVLTVNDRVDSDILVVEGWLPLYGLKEAALMMRTGACHQIFTSGCPASDELGGGGDVTYADWAASRLGRLGLTAATVTSVPCRNQKRDRTYSSALAVKAWFDGHGLKVKSFNLLTLGPHARRSRLLFQKAFGPEVQVGVIAVEQQDYNPARWWRTSEGVREVVGEALAYGYARLLFYPTEADRQAVLQGAGSKP